MVRVMLIQGKSLPLLGVLLSRYLTAMLPEATWDNSAAPAACYHLTQLTPSTWSPQAEVTCGCRKVSLSSFIPLKQGHQISPGKGCLGGGVT